MVFKYRATVLDQLARHGVIPRDDTPPEFVQDFIDDLYRYQIRALKQRMLAGEIAKRDYARRVEELREAYPILGLRPGLWAETE